MKILIYGGGAVGLGLASCLIKSFEQVDILARVNTASALRENGLERIGIFGDFYAAPERFNVFCSLDNLAGIQYDYILICAKSNDSLIVAKDIAAHPLLINDNTKIILFQNGWGNAEVFASLFPEKIIFNARVITGFCRPTLNQVNVTVHAQPIHIGNLFNNNNVQGLNYLCERISNGGIPCEVTEAIEKDLWAKMLYNCALNPLGAIFDVTYGQLGASDQTREIMNNIIEEIFQVMKGANYKTHWDSATEYCSVFYSTLIPRTVDHKSSTLQDVLAYKKTEIEALTGAVLRLAGQYNVPVPCNTQIYTMIKFLEQKYET